ncbi:hypothetical protein AC249_AIPGENE12426 [Exaiptasia diaphana]|nr:hypothetical protein AC249_AIPGENE12426 [Exaiptasia diaphana]
MTTKDNPGTLPINLYAAGSPPVEPLSQAPSVATPDQRRPERLYEQGQQTYTEKYIEVSNIVCVIPNCKSSNGTLELEEGDLILLLEQLQSTNELVTATEAADLSAETQSTDELQITSSNTHVHTLPVLPDELHQPAPENNSTTKPTTTENTVNTPQHFKTEPPDQQQPVTTTRSGRVVKQPEYLQDYLLHT